MRILIAGGFLSGIFHVQSGWNVGLKLSHSYSRPALELLYNLLATNFSWIGNLQMHASKSTTSALAFQTALEARLGALVKMVLYDQSPVIKNKGILELVHCQLFRSSLVQRSKGGVGTCQSQLPLTTTSKPPQPQAARCFSLKGKGIDSIPTCSANSS